jgi:alkylation response protein AidB-like acyl-CoA dehydrogenase
MADVVTPEGLLARVQQLTPVIREHADRGERERHLADHVVQALHDAGFYHLLVPRALGGAPGVIAGKCTVSVPLHSP